jgi:hypothetical protein
LGHRGSARAPATEPCARTRRTAFDETRPLADARSWSCEPSPLPPSQML